MPSNSSQHQYSESEEGSESDDDYDDATSDEDLISVNYLDFITLAKKSRLRNHSALQTLKVVQD